MVAAALHQKSAVDETRLLVAGHPARLDQVVWPPYAELRSATGWQRADTLLARA